MHVADVIMVGAEGEAVVEGGDEDEAGERLQRRVADVATEDLAEDSINGKESVDGRMLEEGREEQRKVGVGEELLHVGIDGVG